MTNTIIVVTIMAPERVKGQHANSLAILTRVLFTELSALIKSV